MLKRYEFRIEEQTPFVGYDLGTTWNGWAMPAFTKEQAVAALDTMTEGDLCGYFYDSHRDRFIVLFFDNHEIDEPEVYYGNEYETEDGDLTLYSIGAGSWCWDAYLINGKVPGEFAPEEDHEDYNPTEVLLKEEGDANERRYEEAMNERHPYYPSMEEEARENAGE